MKKILSALSILFFCLVLTACGGVSQTEYEKVLSERDALQTQINSVESSTTSGEVKSELIQLEIEDKTEDLQAKKEKQNKLQEVIDLVDESIEINDENINPYLVGVMRMIRTFDIVTVKYVNNRHEQKEPFDFFYRYIIDDEIAIYGTSDVEIKSLFYYLYHMYYSDFDDKYDNMKNVISAIPPDYDGFYSEKIQEYCLDYFGSLEDWQTAYNDYSIREKTLLNTPFRTNPQIGMTADEVRKSTWGEPDKINKDTTKYGVSEQWVYSSRGYLYFDDGILRSIQER